MSYSQWLETLVSPISNFITWLSMVADSLIHNYFVITLLGICLFLSLFWLFFYFIHDYVESKIHKYDDFNDMYDRYVLSKKVKLKYLDLHRLDEFEYLTKYLVLKRQVLIHLYNSYPDLMLESKIKNLEFTAQGIRDLKGRQVSDNNPLNDNDADIFVSNPNIQLADSTELKLKRNNPMSFDELHALHLDSVDSINSSIDNIMKDNKDLLSKHNIIYDDISGKFINSYTGEVITNLNEHFRDSSLNRTYELSPDSDEYVIDDKGNKLFRFMNYKDSYFDYIDLHTGKIVDDTFVSEVSKRQYESEQEDFRDEHGYW